MANGRVITGYSKPYVALYANNNGTITYSSGTALARGVDVNVSVDTNDASKFYADNVLAEEAGNLFTSGSITLTVDGLKDAARKLVMGLPTATSVTVGTSTVDVLEYDDRQQIPYVGIGFVVRYMENGVTSYVPYVFPKCIFSEDGIEANTQEESIEFQTTELTATLMRDDSTNHRWRRIAEAQTTEALAEDAVEAMLA